MRTEANVMTQANLIEAYYAVYSFMIFTTFCGKVNAFSCITLYMYDSLWFVFVELQQQMLVFLEAFVAVFTEPFIRLGYIRQFVLFVVLGVLVLLVPLIVKAVVFSVELEGITG